jgi:hypothetical protein
MPEGLRFLRGSCQGIGRIISCQSILTCDIITLIYVRRHSDVKRIINHSVQTLREAPALTREKGESS